MLFFIVNRCTSNLNRQFINLNRHYYIKINAFKTNGDNPSFEISIWILFVFFCPKKYNKNKYHEYLME